MRLNNILYTSQVLEREDTLAQTESNGQSNKVETVSPPPSEHSGKRPSTSARRKRRYAQRSHPLPDKREGSQQSGGKASRHTATPSHQVLSLNDALTSPQQAQRTLSKKEEKALCLAIQDSEFIEQQRRNVFEAAPAGKDAVHTRSSLGDVQAPISGQDYQKLRQWKDAVGANTFADLQARRDRAERAKTMLLHFNRNMSRQFAWRVKRAGSEVAFGELILAGDEALLKAALKWDPKKGAKFSTYAFQRVHRAIVGYMMEHEDVIKIPVHMKELQSKIRRVQPDLTQELGRTPELAEIARKLERPISTIALCMRKMQKPQALDATPTDNEKDSMVDLIASAEDEGPSSLHSAMHRQFANDIEGVLEMLPHKEGDVLALRYGLFNGEPKSLTDAAKLLKMSVEGVRKSELAAFRRLRQVGRLQPLMAYLRETEAHGQGLETAVL